MTEPQYLQARSSYGHKIHAVPANAETIGPSHRLTTGKAICGKVKGRDAYATPTMFLQPDPASVKGHRAFIPSTSAFDKYAAICTDCVRVILKDQP